MKRSGTSRRQVVRNRKRMNRAAGRQGLLLPGQKRRRRRIWPFALVALVVLAAASAGAFALVVYHPFTLHSSAA